MDNNTAINPVSKAQLQQQAGSYYAVLILWPLYLLFLPQIFAHSGWQFVIYLLFPGTFIFTWVGFLLHESWHKFVPNINNAFFYNVFGIMLLSDPQIYHLIHGFHHSQIHTYQDAEFHPLGEIKNRGLRIIYNWLEFIFGTGFLFLAAGLTVPKDRRFAKKYRRWKLLASFFAWAAFFGGIGYLSHLIFGVKPYQIVISYTLCLWLNSFFLHQSQLIEHGNLIVEGTFNQRNIKTRNLKPAGIAEKIILFLTHNDSREHVLHHTQPSVHSRPFPKTIPLPEKAVFITLGDYLKIAGRMLSGKTEELKESI